MKESGIALSRKAEGGTLAKYKNMLIALALHQ